MRLYENLLETERMDEVLRLLGLVLREGGRQWYDEGLVREAWI
jgi:hypothetical protein